MRRRQCVHSGVSPGVGSSFFAGASARIPRHTPENTPTYPRLSMDFAGLLRTLKRPEPLISLGVLACAGQCRTCIWCPEEDSNLHASRRQNLNLVRLPISPSGQRSPLQRPETANYTCFARAGSSSLPHPNSFFACQLATPMHKGAFEGRCCDGRREQSCCEAFLIGACQLHCVRACPLRNPLLSRRRSLLFRHRAFTFPSNPHFGATCSATLWELRE